MCHCDWPSHCEDIKSCENTMPNKHLHKQSKYAHGVWAFMNTLCSCTCCWNMCAYFMYCSLLLSWCCHCVKLQCSHFEICLKAVVRERFRSLTQVKVTIKYLKDSVKSKTYLMHQKEKYSQPLWLLFYIILCLQIIISDAYMKKQYFTVAGPGGVTF